MKRLVGIAWLILAGCGPVTSSPASSVRASATPAPSAAASASGLGPLFAASVGPACGLQCASTVAIVGVDGHIHAQASFTPPTEPLIGCEGGFVASPVTVAAGNVYYLDSANAVHRLSPSGQNQSVAKLPILTTQQLTWFAVSPDGLKLIASVIAWPPLVSPTTNPAQGCPQHVPGDVQETLVMASIDGSVSTLWSKTLAGGVKGPPASLIAVAGWDATGPVATTDTHMVGIGYVEGTTWVGPASHLDAQGHPGSQLGGTDCNPAFGDLPDGRLVCYDPKQPSVRDTAGHVLWRLKALDPTDSYSYGDIALSPDASRVAFNLDSNCCYVFDSSVIRSRDGVRIGLGTTFQPEGWLDNQTVIGAKGSIQVTCSGCPPSFVPSDLALVRVTDPSRIIDLGFKGSYIGLVQAG